MGQKYLHFAIKLKYLIFGAEKIVALARSAFKTTILQYTGTSIAPYHMAWAWSCLYMGAWSYPEGGVTIVPRYFY
jgi:hypothetical protein